MSGATMHDSLLISTLRLLHEEQLVIAQQIGAHEARLTALERQATTGPASSSIPLGMDFPMKINLSALSKAVEFATTAIRLIIWCALHIVPWLVLASAAIWNWLLPYLGKLAVVF